MATKFVKDKDGKLRTEVDYSIPTPEQLEKLRKEVKDLIAGNTVFHVDPYTEYPPIPDYLTENYMYGQDYE